jgi:hypothetical protein
MTNKDKNDLDARKLVCDQTTIERQNYQLIAGMLVEGNEKEEIIEYLKYFVEDCKERGNKSNDMFSKIKTVQLPKLETVNEEVEKYNENTGLQGDKGHFQNGINFAFNYISKQIKG